MFIVGFMVFCIGSSALSKMRWRTSIVLDILGLIWWANNNEKQNLTI